jgi:serine/threonine protein kinase
MASANSSAVRVSTVLGGKKALASRTSQPKLITVRVDTGSESCSTRTTRELEVSNGYEQPHPVLDLSSTSDEDSDSSSSVDGKDVEEEAGSSHSERGENLDAFTINRALKNSTVENQALQKAKSEESDLLSETVNLSQTIYLSSVANNNPKALETDDLGIDVSTPKAGTAPKMVGFSAGSPKAYQTSPLDASSRTASSPRDGNHKTKAKQTFRGHPPGVSGDTKTVVVRSGVKRKKPKKFRKKRSGTRNVRPIVLSPEQFNDMYGLGDRIGSGAYGIVYRGLDKQTGVFLAVKEIQCGQDSMSGMTEVVSEVQILQSLFHPNIVRYVSAAVLWDRLYIFTEWVSGGSLTQILAQFGPLPVGLVAQHTLQILKGLAYLHRQGIIHRDIKGQNILVSKDGRIKLADFGAARLLSNITKGPALFGTPAFLAPEVITNTRSDPKADIWSLGCTIIQMLSGKTPWSPKGFNSVFALLHHVSTTEETPPLENIPSRENTPDLESFLAQCLERDPDSRSDTSSLFLHRFVCTPQVSQKSREDESGQSSSLRKTLEHSDSFEDSFNRSGALKLATAFFHRATGKSQTAPDIFVEPSSAPSTSPITEKQSASVVPSPRVQPMEEPKSTRWDLQSVIPTSSDLAFMDSHERQQAYKREKKHKKKQEGVEIAGSSARGNDEISRATTKSDIQISGNSTGGCCVVC